MLTQFENELRDCHNQMKESLDNLKELAETFQYVLEHLETLKQAFAGQQKEIVQLELELEDAARMLSERK